MTIFYTLLLLVVAVAAFVLARRVTQVERDFRCLKEEAKGRDQLHEAMVTILERSQAGVLLLDRLRNAHTMDERIRLYNEILQTHSSAATRVVGEPSVPANPNPVGGGGVC